MIRGLTMPDTFVYRNGRGHVICDFCSSAEPVWRYHARPAQIGSFPGAAVISRDDWLACEECAALIETESVEDLMDRAIAAMTRLHGEADVDRATAVANVQLAFFSNRTGEREPFG